MLAAIARVLNNSLKKADERDEALSNYKRTKDLLESITEERDRLRVSIRELQYKVRNAQRDYQSDVRVMQETISNYKGQVFAVHNKRVALEKQLAEEQLRIKAMVSRLNSQGKLFNTILDNRDELITELKKENEELKQKLTEPDELREEYDQILKAEEVALEETKEV